MIFRQTRYFEEFGCIGSDCTDNCCNSWEIYWSRNEVKALYSAPDCSDELKRAVDRAFKFNYEYGLFKVMFKENNFCPLLAENGLCMIHRELGERYLSGTCANYPRRYFSFDGSLFYGFCHISCGEVMRRIMNEENSVLLTDPFEASERVHGKFRPEVFSPRAVEARPQLRYGNEIFEFFYRSLCDKRYDTDSNIIYGAYAAQALDEYIAAKRYDEIPALLAELEARTDDGLMKRIQGAKPDIEESVGSIIIFFAEIDTHYKMYKIFADDNGEFRQEYYTEGCEHLRKLCESRPFMLRNIAVQLMYELRTPFGTEGGILDNYIVFAVSFAFMRLLAAATAETIKRVPYESEDNFENYFIKTSGHISRTICHNRRYPWAMLEALRYVGDITPQRVEKYIR